MRLEGQGREMTLTNRKTWAKGRLRTYFCRYCCCYYYYYHHYDDDYY